MDFDPSVLFGPRWGWLSIWVFCFLGLFLLSGILGLAGVHPWSDVSASRVDWYHHEQCEAVSKSGFFLQFHNFWSNASYLLAGLLIVWLSDFAIGKAIGWVFIFLSFGSAWFHGTLTETGQTFDMVGVYSALTVLIAYAFIELTQLEQDGAWSWIAFIVALLLGIAAGMLRPGGFLSVTPFKAFDSDIFTPLLVAVLVVYLVLLPWRRNFQCADNVLWPILGFSIAGVLALIFKFTDGDKNLLASDSGVYSQCAYDPKGFIQGHALWHLLSGIMFICFFEYIRAVNDRSRSIWPWRMSDDAGSY